jgi:hypothetical protein
VLQTADRQSRSIPVPHPQREIPILAEMPRPKMAPVELVRACRNRLDAIILCIQLSRLSQETVAERLGLDKGHLTRMLQGRAYFPDTKSMDLMYVCGNWAPMQYEALTAGFQLYEDPTQKREAELEAELAAIRSRKAA